MIQQKRDLIVGNRRGIHGRVATRLAEIALEYDVIFRIQRGKKSVECSSILDVLALALVEGTAINLQAEGARAVAALAVAAHLITAQDDP
jgi:phosphotransferase system HPr (HPr) family protein